MADQGFDLASHVNNIFNNMAKADTSGKGDGPFDTFVTAVKAWGSNIPFIGPFIKLCDGDYFGSLNTNGLLADTPGFAPMQGKDQLGVLTALFGNGRIHRDFHALTEGIQIAHVDTNCNISPPATPGMGSHGGHDFHVG